MFFGKSRISKKLSIIITITSLLITAGLVWIYVLHPDQKWLMGFIMVMSVVFVLSMNLMISKIAVFKPKPIKYPRGYYKGQKMGSLENKLVKAGFKASPRQFGIGFIKIEEKTAYKIILIKNAESYFNQSNEKQTPTKGIDKCTEFVGFEIFYDVTEEVAKRLPDFSFKGDNVLYEGFYYDPEFDVIVEANKIDPENHLESYNHFKEILEFKECDNPYPVPDNSKKKNK